MVNGFDNFHIPGTACRNEAERALRDKFAQAEVEGTAEEAQRLKDTYGGDAGPLWYVHGSEGKKLEAIDYHYEATVEAGSLLVFNNGNCVHHFLRELPGFSVAGVAP